MKIPILIAILLVLTTFCVSNVGAWTYCGNISFSTLGSSGAEDILIYATSDGHNQTLLGQWNTSSPDVPSPCGDYNIIVRPSSIGRVGNPVLMLTDGFAWVETYWLQLLVLVFLIGALFWKR